MKTIITSVLLGAFFTLFTFIPVGTFTVSSAEAYNHQKMKCLSKGNHWKNGVCYKRKRKSSNTPASKQINGSSDEYFYKRSTAIDLAQTEIMNKTSEYCGTSYKSRITWHDRNTSCKKRNSQYKCKVYATVKCLSESCGKRFCGTRR